MFISMKNRAAIMFAILIGITAAAWADDDKEEIAAARKKSAENLKRVGLAMHQYHDHNGSFPPATIYKDGKPLYSWRVALLPHLDEQGLYTEFKLDEPWDSKSNKELLKKMPEVYHPVRGKVEETTYYQVLAGQDTVFDGKEGIKIGDITDGTSNTILIVEAGVAVPWTKPADLKYDGEKPLPKFGTLFADGFWAAFADGSVRFQSKKLDEKKLRALITRNGGEIIEP